ncbi:hypothetical protein E6O75_ATG09071 [Venturia nashicola]|uniref:Uncharacterized protein n=1 Tax=Venturia nashicola TaxID=86259 RepID=A0A4Z1NMQ8_9PEZI|nr:hypothetical protein E6O75_ATG09071 [Venturia nashicola]
MEIVGYDIPPQRPEQRVILLPKAALVPLAGDSKAANISIFVDNLDVGYVLDLFNYRTGPRIQGFLDRTFWNRVVVQLGYNEPAILSAMRAVCAVYEQVETTGGEFAAMNQCAIAAYSKAIQLVVKESASSKAQESQYDKYKPQFEEMVDQCASIADLSSMYLCDRVGRFQFDMGLVAPLHLIGSRCRWPHIRSYRYIKAIMDLEEAEKIRLLGLTPAESDAHLPSEGARIHFAELGPSDPHSGFQVHTFFTKRFGPLGDWYMQTKSICTSSKDPATDAEEEEEEPQSPYIASMLQKGPEVALNDSSTKAFADRSNG